MIKRIVKYGGTNGVAFVFDTSLLYILDLTTGINRVYLAFFCYICGSLVSFVLAKRFVFPKGWLQEKPAIEFSAYIFGGIIGAVMTAIIFAVLIEAGINNILTQKIIAGFFSFFTVFLYRNFFVFKK
ncbi:GtrA family protein [SAR86 cluster bacterium]|jgi:putative flippase GtrA|nr:GtrA family protein [SAR86 cluster bacterium]|tara:strand:- start:156 stop:536 length:381 start_codon:yes stop_codon:yes gene_type:complete